LDISAVPFFKLDISTARALLCSSCSTFWYICWNRYSYKYKYMYLFRRRATKSRMKN
jgi:hypothetical protein